MRPFFITIILVSLTNYYAQGQGFGEWAAHTSMRTVVGGVEVADGEVWTLTTGGIAIYKDGQFDQMLTTINGLSRLDGTSIAYDENKNKVYIGYINGLLDVIDVNSLSTQSLTDIERSVSFNSKAINDLVVLNKSLFVATDFGIVEYNTENMFVKDSYTKLGILNRGSRVLDLFVSSTQMIAGTEQGVAVTQLDDSFTENDWIVYNQDNGYTSNPTLAVGILNDRLYSSIENENYIFNGTSWAINTNFGSAKISEYRLHPSGSLLALNKNNIFVISSSGVNTKSLGSLNGISIIQQISDTGTILFGTDNLGLSSLNITSSEVESFELEGPFRNYFDGLNFNQDIMIAGSSSSSARNSVIDRSKGYYIFDGETWESYNYYTNPILKTANMMQVFSTLHTEDYYYFGSWGRGIVRHSKEDNEIKIFNHRNSTLRGWASDDPFYPVITGLGKDSKGDVWVVSRYGSTPLYVQTPGDDDWVPFSPNSAVNSSDYYENLFIDSFDQKWIPLEATSTAGNGLLILDTGDKSNPNDDKGIKLTMGENSGNLPNNKIKAIVEDKNNEVWIGTERGVARFLFTDIIIDGGVNERKAQWLINEDTSAVSRYLLRDVNVSAMAVNAANEKWIGSENQGIWVVSEDGGKIIKRFTTQNSPLFSNNIQSIEVNDVDGKVYIATDVGLMSYQDTPKMAVSKMKDLKVFPNPFSYDKHSEIKIEGLTESTSINIIGVDGTVVNTLTKKGGRISWNGLDYNGNRLGTGVYYVVAIANKGSESKGIGKIIIVN
ncbi:MAG: two-component regulator propeller domain-containing protein [Balneolaceae bacterium]